MGKERLHAPCLYAPMSIETTLTLGLALGLLAVALIIRTIALVLWRVALFAWVRFGGTAPAAKPSDVHDALPRIPLGERLAGLGRGISAAALFLAATVASWIELAGRGLVWTGRHVARASRAAWAWSAPRAVSASRTAGRGLRTAWAWFAASFATLMRDLRSSSYPGAHRAGPPARVRTKPTPRVAAAQVAKARAASGTHAGAA